jgi:hypothetical protein
MYGKPRASPKSQWLIHLRRQSTFSTYEKQMVSVHFPLDPNIGHRAHVAGRRSPCYRPVLYAEVLPERRTKCNYS